LNSSNVKVTGDEKAFDKVIADVHLMMNF